MNIIRIEDKGNLLSMEIRNAILIYTYNELELEKFNGEEDPIRDLQGYKYIMELSVELIIN